MKEKEKEFKSEFGDGRLCGLITVGVPIVNVLFKKSIGRRGMHRTPSAMRFYELLTIIDSESDA